MARADRGPLLSSVVLVGLATVATGLLVFIGVQAGRNVTFSQQNGRTAVERDGSDTSVVVGTGESPSPRATSKPGPTRTTGSHGPDPAPKRTGGAQKTKAPPKATAPAPKPSSAKAKPAASPTSSPAPKPSQTTATSRPTPSSQPSPTCTHKDRNGNCKNQQGQGSPSPGGAPAG